MCFKFLSHPTVWTEKPSLELIPVFGRHNLLGWNMGACWICFAQPFCNIVELSNCALIRRHSREVILANMSEKPLCKAILSLVETDLAKRQMCVVAEHVPSRAVKPLE